MNCPECDRELHGDRCRCGWRNVADVAADTMVSDYIARIHAENDEKWLKEARNWCAMHQLDTRDQQRAFVRKMLSSPKFMRPNPPARQREPGDDDEEIHAPG